MEEAITLSDRLGREVGIGKVWGGYSVFALPLPQYRQGHELRCQVVPPGTPRAAGAR
jgi:hypothetical protein